MRTRYLHYQYPMGMRRVCSDCKRKLEGKMQQPPTCEICGVPGTACSTGAVYCTDHAPGKILLPAEWGRLTRDQQERRVLANRSVSNAGVQEPNVEAPWRAS